MSAPLRVAYVAYAFPVLTQTFTTREVLALRDRGIDVRVHASRGDPQAGLDPLAARARGHTTYLPRAASPATLGALLRWSLARPLRTASTLVRCLGGGYRDQPLLSRVRSARHFLLGLVLASRISAEGGYGRIHAQFVDAGSTVAYVAARLTGLPFSFTNHTAYNPFLLAPKAELADVIVSISAFDRERVAAAVPAARSKIAVCRVGIATAEWAHAPRRPEPGRLLCVAALREKKGHADLVDAAAELARRGRPVHLVFAGDGEERGALERRARDRGVALELLGAVGPQRVRDELARAAAFVLPCRVARNGDLDGIPVALMEAMAAGVPVVSTRLSGVPELVEDGVSGYLAGAGDVASLVAALERCLAAVAPAEQVGGMARRRVAALHDLERTSAELARVLSGGEDHAA